MKAFCITGYSGSGKTTLLEAIIPRIAARGLVVSLIKHTHHKFDIDQPGKDSYRLREAGCREVMLLSDNRWVLMHELRGAEPPSLEEQLTKFSDCDLVLVEGFKHAALPKLEVHRPANGKPPLVSTQPEHIVAVASDEVVAVPVGIPLIDLNNRDAVVDFILRHQGLQ